MGIDLTIHSLMVMIDRWMDGWIHCCCRAILGEAKAKFKMGDTKAAHELVGQAMQFSPSTDAEHVLREVEKMSYFENLLNFSLTNPLHAYATTTDQSQLLQQQQK